MMMMMMMMMMIVTIMTATMMMPKMMFQQFPHLHTLAINSFVPSISSMPYKSPNCKWLGVFNPCSRKNRDNFLHFPSRFPASKIYPNTLWQAPQHRAHRLFHTHTAAAAHGAWGVHEHLKYKSWFYDDRSISEDLKKWYTGNVEPNDINQYGKTWFLENMIILSLSYV